VSKRHGAKRRRHSRSARKTILCTACRQPVPSGPRALLDAVATALNACEESGSRVKLRSWSVITAQGYVLAIGDGNGGRWGARTASFTMFPPGDDDDD